jgi:hypothetical protein
MQNGYGARFTGRIRTWKVGSVTIDVSSDVTQMHEGALTVKYEPFAPPKKKEEVQTPF